MKIAFVSLASQGGMHHYVTEVANATSLTGEADVAAVIPHAADASRFSPSVEVVRVSAPEWRTRDLNPTPWRRTSGTTIKFGHPDRHIWSVRHLVRALNLLSPDVVHLNSGHIWYSLLAPRLSRRFLLGATLHDVVPHPGENSIRRRHEIATLLRWSRVVFVHTSALRAAAEVAVQGQRRTAQAPRVVEIRHGDYGQFGALDRSKRDMRPTGLFFGRIRDYKGVDVLLDALPHIRKCIPDFRLIVAGSGADRRLRERITNEPEVDFYDRFIEDAEVPGLFGSADVVILPYREASWSGVASLAANYGIPIVGGAVGGLSEQLAHGGLGQRVPPDRADLLAEAVVATLRDVSRTEHQPSAGIGRTVSWASAAEVTVQTYQELLGIAR